MASPKFAVLVLGAGLGTRMKSSIPKVFHQFAGRSMIDHVLSATKESGASDIVAVMGPEAEGFERPGVVTAIQRERLGTGHAARIGFEALQAKGTKAEKVLVLFGDAALIPAEAILRLASQEAAVTVAAFEADDPTGYGRLVLANGAPKAIVEHKDANAAQKEITLCNGGLMAFDIGFMAEAINQLSSDNAQKEYYLTDMVELALSANKTTSHVTIAERDVLGVNSREQLAAVEALFQEAARKQHMANGVTLIDPGSVFFCHDTQVAADVVIEPNVFFGPNVCVQSGAVIKAFSHIEGDEKKSVTIGENVAVGPYARLRPGADLAKGSKIGNFVEVKNARFEEGAKANHLSYVGDARVGKSANIGAGTITCNYDGYLKHQTTIGEGAFIGSNTALVAPVSVGDGATVGAGSTIARDVDNDALAVTRAELRVVESGGAKLRKKLAKLKADKQSKAAS